MILNVGVRKLGVRSDEAPRLHVTAATGTLLCEEPLNSDEKLLGVVLGTVQCNGLGALMLHIYF